jgi:hypothetical protein
MGEGPRGTQMILLSSNLLPYLAPMLLLEPLCEEPYCHNPRNSIRGWCSTHYRWWQRATPPHLRPHSGTTPCRVEYENGEPVRKECKACSRMLPLAAFPKNKSGKLGLQSTCSPCTCERVAKYHDRNKEKDRAYHQAYAQRRLKLTKKHDRKYQAWITTQGRRTQIPNDTVRPLLEELVAVAGSQKDAATAARIDERVVYRILVEQTTSEADTVERILIALDRQADINKILPPVGVENWSRAGHRHCADCGTWFHPHCANGFCHPCYQRSRRATHHMRRGVRALA